MKDISKQIAAYEEILEVVNKHRDVVDSYAVSLDCVDKVVSHMKVAQRFGVPLRSITGNYEDWLDIQDCYTDTIHLGLFGEKEGRTISWSDNGSQPEGEWLLNIGFSCGAYTFAPYASENFYPKKTFDKFFDELKSFGPAFCDTNNHNLYFREDKSAEVYQALWPLFDKYKELVNDERKEQRRAELQRELENLK